jgi:class 3 adenylate cyclase/streptogramin lyase
MAPGEREHALLAVLFTDIVGSSELAAQMGDESWKRVLRRHHEIMRGVVGDNGGRIVDTAGDGVFAVFHRPAAAIRCAFEGIYALRAIGLEIRAGIHFGEAESSEGRVSGIVVHTAARVMALAGPGEIFITRTVQDLVAGKRITVGDRGSHDLKGIPSRWDVFVVEEVEGKRRSPPIDPGVAQGLRERSVPPEPRRRLPIVLVVIAALILTIVGIALVAGDGAAPDEPVVALTTLVRIDQETQKRSEVDVGDGVSGVALGEGSVWLASFRDRTVYEVDPETLRVRTRIPMPEQPQEIAAGAGSVWVTSSTTLFRINPITGRVADRTPLGGCSQSDLCATDVVAAADGIVWATHFDSERLVRHDPVRGGSERIHLFSWPIAMAVGHGAVWILHDDDPNVFLIERFDIRAGTSTVEVLPFESYYSPLCLEHDVGSADAAELCASITVGRRAVWVATPGDEVSWLWRLDPDDGDRTADGVAIDCCAMAMAGTADPLETIWIGRSSGDIMQVREVEGVPSNGEVAVGAPVTDIAIGFGAIWASVDGPPA